MLTTERQQFEEWIKFHSDEEECTNLLQRNSAGTNYLHPHTDLAWIAWQASREVLAKREAQPVAYTEQCEISNMQATGLYLRGFPDNSQGRNIPLYTAPPALAVPDEMPRQYQNGWPLDYSEYASGWNACRAAMLAAVPEGGNG
ncbi:hypothetical protein JY462_11030 [Serratia marcescens]|nr:hypothetical protein [Serratia marcescens]